MKLINTRKYPISVQYVICIALVLFVSVLSFYLQEYIGYRVVALLLLMAVSFIAMLFDILPVITTAVLSAFIWNFFFIPPLFTFHIDKVEDVLFFFLYFFIALINTVLSFKIREAEKRARDKEEKENILRLYNTLFNSLSHELRTPISTIIGALDTLKENKATLSGENQAELLSVVDKASFRLNREVDNLLNMSRLESGMLKLNVDWCDLGELIHTVVRKLIPFGNKTIEFSPDENLPFFRLDAGIIEQVVYNLLHNALHHTPESTIIKVDVSHNLDFCVIRISDNGQGFPENEIPFVFNKFYRLKENKTGGSGLGLSIVKGFVEAHKGKVTLENNNSGGAEFTIEIPAEATYINSLKNE
jgi:two-component system, OmpR family, sensor histidine kinase KdpD